jgi:hypothetical protein
MKKMSLVTGAARLTDLAAAGGILPGQGLDNDFFFLNRSLAFLCLAILIRRTANQQQGGQNHNYFLNHFFPGELYVYSGKPPSLPQQRRADFIISMKMIKGLTGLVNNLIKCFNS